MLQDWTPTLEAAIQHGTVALVCKHLQALSENVVPPELSAAARTFLTQQKETFDAGVAQWAEVLSVLDAAGIEAIPYKGPVSAWAYGDHPWLRSFRDLDFLVRDADFEPAIAVLDRLGYHEAGLPLPDWQRRAIRRRARQETLYGPGLAIEPHFGFGPGSLGLDLQADGVFARSREARVLGREVRLMSPADTFLMLALHGGKERWTRLIWVVDVAEHLKANPDLDWATAFHLAEASGLRRCVRLAVLLAHDLLGAPVPPGVLRAARSDKAGSELASQVAACLSSPQPTDPWLTVKSFQSRLIERRRDRWRALVESVLEVREEDYASVRLPRVLGAGFVAVKAARRMAALVTALSDAR